MKKINPTTLKNKRRFTAKPKGGFVQDPPRHGIKGPGNLKRLNIIKGR